MPASIAQGVPAAEVPVVGVGRAEARAPSSRLAAQLALVGSVSSDGPEAIRGLEDAVTDIWIRLLRAS